MVYHSFDQLSSISQLIFKICLFSLLTNSFRLAFSTNETFLYSVSSCMRLSHILRKYWILYNDIQSKYFPSRNTLCTCLEDLVYDWHIHCVDNGRLCLFSFDMFTVENGLWTIDKWSFEFDESNNSTRSIINSTDSLFVRREFDLLTKEYDWIFRFLVSMSRPNKLYIFFLLYSFVQFFMNSDMQLQHLASKFEWMVVDTFCILSIRVLMSNWIKNKSKWFQHIDNWGTFNVWFFAFR